MLFKSVVDITIPQGKVKKIHETVGGRVLWEKKQYDIDIPQTVYGFWKHNNDYIYDNQLYLCPEDNYYTETYPRYIKYQVGDIFSFYYVPYDYKKASIENVQRDKQLFPVTAKWISYYGITPLTANLVSEEDISNHLITISNYVGNTVSIISTDCDVNGVLSCIENSEIIKNNYPKSSYPFFGVNERIYISCKVRRGMFTGDVRGLGVLIMDKSIRLTR